MLRDCYEPELMSVIRKCVPAGGTTFDIGTNAGPVTLALADQVGCSGRVYSFEPGPVIYGRLVYNINLMGYELFKLDPVKGLLRATAEDFRQNTIALPLESSARIKSLFW